MKKFILAGFGIFLIVFIFWAVHRIGLFAPPTLAPGETRIVSFIQSSQDSLSPVPYTYEPYVENLTVPWSIVFTSPDRLLVTERLGRIRAIRTGKLEPDSLITFSEVSSEDEEGLMGMALDPFYEENKYIYVCLAYQHEGTQWDKVIRLIDHEQTIEVDKVILERIPSAQFHAGCRLKFGPDHNLYITTGDATNKQLPQDISSLGGKILRIKPDGSIPSDNPFPNSPVYSYGHRNSQGIDWHPATHELYSTEHGPSVFDGPAGGDEINHIIAGGNYGWPLVSHDDNREGLVGPLTTFTPAEAPSAGMFYAGSVFPQFTNDFFVAALKGEGILRIKFASSDPDTVLEIEKLPIEVGRVREIVQGPDGFIYFATSNRDGRGTVHDNDDHIYRLIPKE